MRAVQQPVALSKIIASQVVDLFICRRIDFFEKFYGGPAVKYGKVSEQGRVIIPDHLVFGRDFLMKKSLQIRLSDQLEALLKRSFFGINID